MKDESEQIALGDIGRLMAELDEVKFERDQLKAERDAALATPHECYEMLKDEFVRGLERAREIAYTVWHERDYFDDLIQAEIDKAKAGK